MTDTTKYLELICNKYIGWFDRFILDQTGERGD